MGCAQVVSLLPGISRSGATISSGLLARGDPGTVARFSFLMSVPAVLGAVALQLAGLDALPAREAFWPLAVGFCAALLSGLVAIRLLLRVVSGGRFYLFGIYCVIAGAFGWWWLGRLP